MNEARRGLAALVLAAMIPMLPGIWQLGLKPTVRLESLGSLVRVPALRPWWSGC